MVVAEGPKMFDLNAFGKEYLRVLKKFLFLSISGLYFI